MTYDTNGSPYDIRQHLNALTRSKGSKTKFNCPACNGNDLDILMSRSLPSAIVPNSIILANTLETPIFNHKHIFVGFDCEWVGSTHPNGIEEQVEAFMCMQVAIRSPSDGDILKICFLGVKYATPRNMELALEAGFNRVVPITDSQVRAGMLHLIPELFDKPLCLSFVYSTTDLSYALGFAYTIESIKSNKIIRSRCHKLSHDVKVLKAGELNIVVIRDTTGFTDGSWQSTLDGLGIPTTDKAKSKDWDKGRMDKVLENYPLDFFKYGLEDATTIQLYWKAMVENINDIRGIWGLKPWILDDLPHTTGTLVYRIFSEFLNSKIPNLDVARVLTGRWACDSDVNQTVEHIKFNVMRNQDNLTSILNLITSTLKKITHGDCLSGASIPSLATEYLNTTGKNNIIVQGGRCHNENTSVNIVKGRIADIDLKGCYGSALSTFDYPIGIPTVFHKAEGNIKITLGEFLKINESELVPNLWQIIVNGKFNFQQYLVASKIVKDVELRKAAISTCGDELDDFTRLDSDEISKVSGDFIILTNEIINGVITADVLNKIISISTNNELKQWMGLEVITACYYPKSLEVKTDDYIHSTARYYNPVKVSACGKSVFDNRYRGWCRLSIEEFIKPLVDKRMMVKEMVKTNPKLKGMDSILKLFINTLYGVIASPYFPIGNSVIANNITAKARVGAWMMAKPLDLFQTITDGGTYNCDAVRYINPKVSQFKKPGFNILYDRDKWCDARKIRGFKSLDIKVDGLNPWTNLKWFNQHSNYNKVGKILDKVAIEHINNFWSNYNLKLDFEIEHKGSNTSTHLATYGKADYALKTIGTDEIKYKIRGARDLRSAASNGRLVRIHNDGEDIYELPITHPKYQILTALINGDDRIDFSDLTYHTTKLQTINGWLQSPNSQSYILPGQSYALRSVFHLFPTHIHFKTWDAAESFATGKCKHRHQEVKWATQPNCIPSILGKWATNPEIRFAKMS